MVVRLEMAQKSLWITMIIDLIMITIIRIKTSTVIFKDFQFLHLIIKEILITIKKNHIFLLKILEIDLFNIIIINIIYKITMEMIKKY